MQVRTTTNVHLTADTHIKARSMSNFVTIEIGDSVFLYIHDENELAELMQACDQAAKYFA